MCEEAKRRTGNALVGVRVHGERNGDVGVEIIAGRESAATAHDTVSSGSSRRTSG